MDDMCSPLHSSALISRSKVEHAQIEQIFFENFYHNSNGISLFNSLKNFFRTDNSLNCVSKICIFKRFIFDCEVLWCSIPICHAAINLLHRFFVASSHREYASFSKGSKELQTSPLSPLGSHKINSFFSAGPNSFKTLLWCIVEMLRSADRVIFRRKTSRNLGFFVYWLNEVHTTLCRPYSCFA